MNEKLIFSNIKQFPLIRELAQNGINTVGYRIFNVNELVPYIRLKHLISPTKRQVSNKEKTYIYNLLIENSSYFTGATYEDAKSLCETIDSIRELIEEDEDKVLKDKLTNSIYFKEKNEAIYDIYCQYIKYLNDNNLTDLIVEERNLITSQLKIDKDITIFIEDDISPLSFKLLNTCFNNVIQINFRELFNVKESINTFTDNLYKTKGYGHEVKNVFKIIHDKELPIDTCTIVYTKYSNFYHSIKEQSKLLNVPVNYIDGIQAVEYNAYRLLNLIIRHHDNLYGFNTLKDILYDKSFNYSKLFNQIVIKEYFNDYLRLIGDLKFSFDAEENDRIFKNYKDTNTRFVDEVEQFKNILNNGIISFIRDYVINDDNVITSSVLNDIELYININDKYDFEFFKSLCNHNVNSSYAKEGTISVCSILKAKENIRKNMFFIGNDSDSFHITLCENTFISDEKLLEISPKYAKTSLKLASLKKKQYEDVIELCRDLGVNMYISYTDIDEIELKNHNFVSSLYILNQKVDPNLTFKDFRGKFKETKGYIGNNISKDEALLTTYIDKSKRIITNTILNETEKRISDLLSKTYSPTEIEEALGCKRKFLIKRILKVDDPEDYDVFKKFENMDLGNMFHDVMKFANDKSKVLQDVLEYAEQIFNATCAMRNPILQYELAKEKEDFMRIVEIGFNYLSKKQEGVAEKMIEKDIAINSDTLHFKGKPDLVTDDAIIDYKAKRKLSHVENDKLSCIQALIYALVNAERPITHVEYYYPFFRKTIKTDFNKADVESILNTFIDCLKSSDFTPAYVGHEKETLDICKYCKFGEVCGKNK